jgi:hypothetical protein
MFKTAMLVLVTLALVAFAAANWAAFSTPTVLTLGVAQFTAPLGVLMLAVLGVVVLLFLASLAVWQARILGDSRRHAREIAALRTLADDAEASRLTALRTSLGEEVARLELRVTESQAQTRLQIQEGVDSLAAMIAEMDDRLHRDGDTTALDARTLPVRPPH